MNTTRNRPKSIQQRWQEDARKLELITPRLCRLLLSDEVVLEDMDIERVKWDAEDLLDAIQHRERRDGRREAIRQLREGVNGRTEAEIATARRLADRLERKERRSRQPQQQQQQEDET